MKYLKRLFGLPFALALCIISSVFNILQFGYHFMKHGFELIAYPEPQARIVDVFNLLREELGIEDLEEERAEGERAPR